MKKIYGFLGAMTLFAMASCSNENLGGPEVPDASVQGDMFMTMNIIQTSTSRTATPNQGVEAGKDRENKINSALVIFAKPDQDGKDYTVFEVITVGGSSGSANSEIIPGASSSGSNLAVFEVTRKTFQDDITQNGGSVEYSIFVVANPTTTITGKITKNGKLQQDFELLADAETYWATSGTGGNFLMSNKTAPTTTITTADVAAGTHTTSSQALHLGTVEIQRAMSRFDLWTGNDATHFELTPENNEEDYKVEIDFVEVALVNQATKAYLFKVTADSAALNDKMIAFDDEKEKNWVWTPTQTSFTLPLFGDGSAPSGKLTGTTNAYASLEWKKITEITENDNVFTHEGNSAAPDLQNKYYIWRYCMENTNPDVWDNQVNGNSTGVVFKAKMTASKAGATVSTPVYALNSVILGTFQDLLTYVTNQKNDAEDPGTYELVQIYWSAAINAYNAEHPDSKYDMEDNEEHDNNWWGADKNKDTLEDAIKTYLVKEKFTIYTPTTEDGKSVFYCYYIYWNRHNDNGKETQMGAMEFATVRNNVYKLKVTGVNRLGHPGEPGNDPDDPTPDTPDEKDHLFFSVDCKVLPWEVRVNDIIF